MFVVILLTEVSSQRVRAAARLSTLPHDTLHSTMCYIIYFFSILRLAPYLFHVSSSIAYLCFISAIIFSLHAYSYTKIAFPTFFFQRYSNNTCLVFIGQP